MSAKNRCFFIDGFPEKENKESYRKIQVYIYTAENFLFRTLVKHLNLVFYLFAPFKAIMKS